jgi:pimeloyl-ACP methyl ester carboxylesterase
MESLGGVRLWHRSVRGADGVRLHAVEAGSGPLVVLLHGFPEFWYGWRHQLPALARAGFHAVAPDLRGYNLSDKPASLEAYRADRVAEDVAALVRELSDGRGVAVVGHDWGGIIAWLLAARAPELVDRLAILNAPHPRQFRATLRRPTQLLRSWYMGLFQLPLLPEALLSAGDFALLRRALRADALREGAFTDADLQRYAEAFGQPGALTASLNYYRASVRHPLEESQFPERPVLAPTLVVWGRKDPHLVPDLARVDGDLVRDVRVEELPEAGHFVQHDAPDRVNALLGDFLAPLLPSRGGRRSPGSVGSGEHPAPGP